MKVDAMSNEAWLMSKFETDGGRETEENAKQGLLRQVKKADTSLSFFFTVNRRKNSQGVEEKTFAKERERSAVVI